MPLINCKVELKRKWTIHCFRFGGVDNANANSNNVIFTIKDTELYVLVVICQQKTIKTIKTS